MSGETLELIFVTGNAKKAQEVTFALENRGVQLPGKGLQTLKLDLPELQGEPEEIAQKKCQEAYERILKERGCEDGPFLVIIEDTSLCYNALQGLPGP